MKIFVMFILVLFGFSFVELQAKPDLARKEFVYLDKYQMSPKIYFQNEVVKTREFDKDLAVKLSKQNLLKAKKADTTYKNVIAQRKANEKPLIRLL